MARLRLIGLILSSLLLIQVAAEKSEPDPVPNELSKYQTTGFLRRDEVAEEPASSAGEEADSAEAPSAIRRLGKHHSDKSVAGGGVIIGGLVTAIFAAVFCYIRVTRKRNDVV